MQLYFLTRKRGGWENEQGPVTFAPDAIARAIQGKAAVLLAAKECGCYAGGEHPWNPWLEQITGQRKNVCLFHATKIGDTVYSRCTGTLAELGQVDDCLGVEYLLPEPRTDVTTRLDHRWTGAAIDARITHIYCDIVHEHTYRNITLASYQRVLALSGGNYHCAFTRSWRSSRVRRLEEEWEAQSRV